jgi:hypothetical protein
LGKSLEQHLDAVARRMGRFLRGFDDPKFHVGSADLFVQEFKIVMDLPALHSPGDERTISYSEAAGSFRVSPTATVHKEQEDPVSAMVRGLGESSLFIAREGKELALDKLREDLAALLRVPTLLFYFQISDRTAFFTNLEQMAKKFDFPVVTGGGESIPGNCPVCGSNLPPGRHRRILKCGACGRALEMVRLLPLVSGIAATVSYEMLRRMVALDQVASYQEEGNIRPL